MPRVKKTNNTVTSNKKISSTTAKVIHDVQILDSSYSMLGEKYDVAVKGIQQDFLALQKLAKENPNVKYTYTLVEFSDNMRIHLRIVDPLKSELPHFTNFKSNTSLNQTIGETIELLLSEKKETDNVLVKIFTDGEENSSTGKYKNKEVLSSLIDRVQEQNNFTITFIGTKKDVNTVIRDLKIKSSNTLSHNNTLQSINTAFNTTTVSRSMYSKAVMDGLDVKEEFYKKESIQTV
jgi:uncharacterized protein YegL